LAITDLPDNPNWKVEDTGTLNQKITRDFFSTHLACDRGKIIWSNFIPPTKTLVFWKLLHRCLLTDLDAQKRSVYVCSMCSLCKLQVEDIDHFFSCSAISFIWTWLRNICPDLMNFSYVVFINFKAPGSPLIRLVKLSIINFCLWMN